MRVMMQCDVMMPWKHAVRKTCHTEVLWSEMEELSVLSHQQQPHYKVLVQNSGLTFVKFQLPSLIRQGGLPAALRQGLSCPQVSLLNWRFGSFLVCVLEFCIH